MSVEDVQSTLFFPLLGRAEASRRWPDAFPDPWAHRAEEIAKSEKTTARSLGTVPAVVYGLRHLITLTEIRRYLQVHPGAAVVNIGCGLDQLGPELGGDSVIYNLDYPDVMDMRARWIETGPRDVDLAYSVTDNAWMDKVDARRGMIAIAAGVFYYLEVSDVQTLVAAMAERFPGGRLAYDSESPRIIRGSERSIRRKGVEQAPMPFKVADPFSVRGWSNKVGDVSVEFNFTHYLAPKDRSVLPFSVRALFAAMSIIKGMYEVVVDFAGNPVEEISR